MGDIPQRRYTIKFKTSRTTNVNCSQTVQADGIPCHVKDLLPFRGSYSLSEHEGDSTESELLVDLRSTSPNDSLDTSSEETGAEGPNDSSRGDSSDD